MTPAKPINIQELKEEIANGTPAKKSVAASGAKPTTTKKKILPKGPGIRKAPGGAVLAEDTSDYSHIYRNFYDIFVGSFADTKGFDLNYAVRENRNTQAGFVNLMNNSLVLSQKH